MTRNNVGLSVVVAVVDASTANTIKSAATVASIVAAASPGCLYRGVGGHWGGDVSGGGSDGGRYGGRGGLLWG